MEPFPISFPKGRVYLDQNATSPLAQSVEDQMISWSKVWGNPSSIHTEGRPAKALLRESRKKISHLIGAHPLEVIFTSGGSEANNMALKGVWEHLERTDSQRNRYIFSSIEHPSVREVMAFLKQKGAQVFLLPVSREGELDKKSYEELLDEKTALVSVMYANNETGHIFPIEDMVQKAHEAGALFHCDGVQTLGKMDVDVQKWGVDLASFSGHKFYALKGCGVLYMRKGLELEPLIHGGGQERRRRSGTENLLSIASLAEMASYKEEVTSRSTYVKTLRDEMEKKLLSQIPHLVITGKNTPRVGNTSHFFIPNVSGESLLMNLDLKGFSLSAGSACGSGRTDINTVLKAMNFSESEASSSLRVSLGWYHCYEDIELFVKTLTETVSKMRELKRVREENNL